MANQTNGLDDFGVDTARRVNIAREQHDGHPSWAWSTGEQIAVALVLRDREHLAAMGYTTQEAAHRVRGGMFTPPRDFPAWVEAVRELAHDLAGDL